jgi:hypothetical protein
MSVADYLNRLKTSNNTSTNSTQIDDDIAKLIQALSLAKSATVKSLDDEQKAIVKAMKNQEKLLSQLIQGEALSDNQRNEFVSAIQLFNKGMADYDYSLKNLIKGFDKVKSTEGLDPAFKKRLENDLSKLVSKETTSEQKQLVDSMLHGEKVNKQVLKLITDIKLSTTSINNELEQSRMESRSAWDRFNFNMSNMLDKFKDTIGDKGFWSDLAKTLFATGAIGGIIGLLQSMKGWFDKRVSDFQNHPFAFGMGTAENAARLPMYKKFFDSISKSFEENPMIKNFKESKFGKGMSNVFTKIGEGTKSLVNFAKERTGFVKVEEGMAKLGELFKGVSIFGAKIAKTTSKVVEPLIKTFGRFLKPIVEFTGKYLKFLEPVAKLLGKLSEKVLFPLFTAIDFIYGFATTSGDIGNKVKGGLANVLSGLTLGIVHRDTFDKMLGTQSASMPTNAQAKAAGLPNLPRVSTSGNAPSNLPSSYNNVKNTKGVGLFNSIGSLFKSATGHKGGALFDAIHSIVGSNTHPGGYCYKGVKAAVNAAGLGNLTGGSAYMAASQLANNKNFKQIAMSPSQLGGLPRGSIVVWGKGTTPHGHISIADGSGHEYSDFVGTQCTETSRRDGLHYGAPSVFLPAGATGFGAGEVDGDYGYEDYVGVLNKFVTAISPITSMFSSATSGLLSNYTNKISQYSGIASGDYSSVSPISAIRGYASSNSKLSSIMSTIGTIKEAYSGVKNSVSTANMSQKITNSDISSRESVPQLRNYMPQSNVPDKKTDIYDPELAMFQTLVFAD